MKTFYLISTVFFGSVLVEFLIRHDWLGFTLCAVFQFVTAKGYNKFNKK